MNNKKRGISPLISAVLLVSLTVVLFLLISNWVNRGVFQESVGGTEDRLARNSNCLDVAIDVTAACVDVPALATEVELNVDNVGTAVVDSIDVRVLNSAGALGSATGAGSAANQLGRVSSLGTAIALDTNVANPTTVEVYPVANGEICADKVITTSNIGTC